MILACSHVNKAFGEKDIICDATFHIEEHEKAAIVGINGAGKSTLLKIIMGIMSRDSGEVIIAKDKTIGYLAQHQDLNTERTIYEEVRSVKQDVIDLEQRIRRLEQGMKHTPEGEALDTLMNQYALANHEFEMKNGYALESEVTGILKGLGFNPQEFTKPVNCLSGGQKTRVSLGKLLLSKPDIILLDEPTNHLDMNSITWLEGYLQNYANSVIIVAHDRYFLDRVVTKIIEVDNTRVRTYMGNYTQYGEKKQQLRVALMNAYMNQQRDIKHQEEVIAKLKSFNREKSIKRAESREKMLDKVEVLEKPDDSSDQAKMRIHLDPRVVSGNDVLTIRGLTKQFGSQVLFQDVDIDLKRGERLAIIGDNGTGKTTLLKIIDGMQEAQAGQIKLGSKVTIGYYDQEHQVLHMEKTLFEEMSDAYPTLTNTQIRNVLAAFLFTGDDVFKLIRDLSGGERGRVSLAKLMLSESNLLILDEPTNHLDIMSKEILEHALQDYTGTVLYVSHDRYFINQTATRILELEHERFTNYIGNYDYYLQKKQEAMATANAVAAATAAAMTRTGGTADSGLGAGIGSLAGASKTGEANLDIGNRISNVTVGTATGGAGNSSNGNSNGNGSTTTDWKAQKEEQARLRKRRNDLQKTEEQIEKLETENGQLDEELTKEEVYTDVSRLLEINNRKKVIEEELETLYESWEALSIE